MSESGLVGNATLHTSPSGSLFFDKVFFGGQAITVDAAEIAPTGGDIVFQPLLMLPKRLVELLPGSIGNDVKPRLDEDGQELVQYKDANGAPVVVQGGNVDFENSGSLDFRFEGEAYVLTVPAPNPAGDGEGNLEPIRLGVSLDFRLTQTLYTILRVVEGIDSELARQELVTHTREFAHQTLSELCLRDHKFLRDHRENVPRSLHSMLTFVQFVRHSRRTLVSSLKLQEKVHDKMTSILNDICIELAFKSLEGKVSEIRASKASEAAARDVMQDAGNKVTRKAAEIARQQLDEGAELAAKRLAELRKQQRALVEQLEAGTDAFEKLARSIGNGVDGATGELVARQRELVTINERQITLDPDASSDLWQLVTATDKVFDAAREKLPGQIGSSLGHSRRQIQAAQNKIRQALAEQRKMVRQVQKASLSYKKLADEIFEATEHRTMLEAYSRKVGELVSETTISGDVAAQQLNELLGKLEGAKNVPVGLRANLHKTADELFHAADLEARAREVADSDYSRYMQDLIDDTPRQYSVTRLGGDPDLEATAKHAWDEFREAMAAHHQRLTGIKSITPLTDAEAHNKVIAGRIKSITKKRVLRGFMNESDERIDAAFAKTPKGLPSTVEETTADFMNLITWALGGKGVGAFFRQVLRGPTPSELTVRILGWLATRIFELYNFILESVVRFVGEVLPQYVSKRSGIAGLETQNEVAAARRDMFALGLPSSFFDPSPIAERMVKPLRPENFPTSVKGEQQFRASVASQFKGWTREFATERVIGSRKFAIRLCQKALDVDNLFKPTTSDPTAIWGHLTDVTTRAREFEAAFAAGKGDGTLPQRYFDYGDRVGIAFRTGQWNWQDFETFLDWVTWLLTWATRFGALLVAAPAALVADKRASNAEMLVRLLRLLVSSLGTNLDIFALQQDSLLACMLTYEELFEGRRRVAE